VLDGVLWHGVGGRWSLVADAACTGRNVTDLVVTPEKVRLRCGSTWELGARGGWTETPADADAGVAAWVPVGAPTTRSLDVVTVRRGAVEIRALADDRTDTVLVDPMPADIPWVFVAASPLTLLAGITVGEQFAVLGDDHHWTARRSSLLSVFAPTGLAWTDGVDVVFAQPIGFTPGLYTPAGVVVRCALR
jgi:hypothetical protein